MLVNQKALFPKTAAPTASEESRRIRATFVKNPAAFEIPLAVERRQWEESVANVELPDGITITPDVIADVACEWVRHNQPNQQSRQRVLFYLHGGGFVSGSCKTHRELAARLAIATQLSVLLVDYRLAPEHPFPAAVEDCLQVYRSLLATDTPPTQIIFGGDSAGGGLVMSTLLMLRQQNLPQPAAAILLSPWVDLAMTGESIDSRAALDALTTQEDLRRCAAHYLGTTDAYDPIAAPVYADLHDLPPLLIYAGDHEILLSDAVRLAENARIARVAARLEVWPEMWHVWPAWAATLLEGQVVLEQIGEYVATLRIGD